MVIFGLLHWRSIHCFICIHGGVREFLIAFHNYLAAFSRVSSLPCICSFVNTVELFFHLILDVKHYFRPEYEKIK